jgi:citrate lyase beta subunit
MSKLTRQNVRAFLERDWALARRTKDEAVARYVQVRGAASAGALGQALLDQVWPRINEPARRAEDLAHHLAMRKKLRTASRRRR